MTRALRFTFGVYAKRVPLAGHFKTCYFIQELLIILYLPMYTQACSLTFPQYAPQGSVLISEFKLDLVVVHSVRAHVQSDRLYQGLIELN